MRIFNAVLFTSKIIRTTASKPPKNISLENMTSEKICASDTEIIGTKNAHVLHL